MKLAYKDSKTWLIQLKEPELTGQCIIFNNYSKESCTRPTKYTQVK